MQAIETTGVVDEQHQLRLDTPLPIPGASRVRVIVLWPEPAELNEADWLRAASANPAFDFLKEETENLYTVNDGKPFQHQGVRWSSCRSPLTTFPRQRSDPPCA